MIKANVPALIYVHETNDTYQFFIRIKTGDIENPELKRLWANLQTLPGLYMAQPIKAPFDSKGPKGLINVTELGGESTVIQLTFKKSIFSLS